MRLGWRRVSRLAGGVVGDGWGIHFAVGGGAEEDVTAAECGDGVEEEGDVLLPEVGGVEATPGGGLGEDLNANRCVRRNGEEGGDVPPSLEDVGGEEGGEEQEKVEGPQPGEEGDDSDVFEIAAEELFEEALPFGGGERLGEDEEAGAEVEGLHEDGLAAEEGVAAGGAGVGTPSLADGAGHGDLAGLEPVYAVHGIEQVDYGRKFSLNDQHGRVSS